VDDSSVKSSIRVLLTRFVSLSLFGLRLRGGLLSIMCDRCLDDVDDEVRDRAAMYLKVLEDKPLAETFVKDGKGYALATNRDEPD
jgi:hypothetical protein